MNLTKKVSNLPLLPGVYIYKDEAGNILYVGKAKALRTRVQSYFRDNAALDPAKQEMVTKIVDIETITVDSETEALILEANLIRKHQPPYNVVLRDDKYYLFIKITKEALPRVYPVRKISRDGARYFGPYSSARSVRQTLKLLRRIFPYREEKESPREIVFPHPLFNQSSRDLSSRRETPQRDVSLHSDSLSLSTTENLPARPRMPLEETREDWQKNQYHQNIENIIRFLTGHRQEIVNILQRGMKQASADGNFEQAAIFRDQLYAIERLEGDQKVYLPRKESFDVVSIARRAGKSAANVFQIREGKLLGKHTFLLQHRSTSSPEDTLRQFLLQYYRVAQDIPKLILIPTKLSDEETIATYINTNVPISFAVPARGKKRQLLELGSRNADMLLDEGEAVFESESKARTALASLFEAIGLPTEPILQKERVTRVEIYDISNIQGSLATASMAVFEDGLPKTQKYRKFRIHIDGKPNDFAMLQETLTRRFKNHQQDWPIPDLVIIDGGKGQLSSSVKALKKLGVSVPIISIAKREEEIFTPGSSASIRLPVDSPALHVIQRMRDEAHRFTITYHRLLRSKAQRSSLLDEIPGIGPKTKKQLLARFGSLKGIRAASDKDIASVIGSAKLKTLREYL